MAKSKKTLDTLVEDIYNKIGVLADGEHIDLDPETIDQFGESMKEILYKWSHPEPRGDATLRMSNIGRKPRQLWFDMKSEGTAEKMPPSLFIKFLYGHLLEEIVIFLIKLSGHKVTSEQKEIYDAIINGPRGHVVGPLRVWLNNPGLARSAQTVGAYARYGTCLSKGLSELAIIVTGRVWSSAFEWEHHAPLAIEGGIDPKHVETISLGKKPIFDNPEQNAVFDFAAEANIKKNVSDNTYKRLVDLLGENAAIDIVGICGYYSLISMTLNVFKVPNDTDKWPLPEVKDFSEMVKS